MKTFDLSMQQNERRLTPVVKQFTPVIAASMRSVLALSGVILIQLLF